MVGEVVLGKVILHPDVEKKMKDGLHKMNSYKKESKW